MTKKEEKELAKEIEILESDESQIHNERQEELDWITEQLVEMDDANFKRFMHSIRHARKASYFRGEMSLHA